MQRVNIGQIKRFHAGYKKICISTSVPYLLLAERNRWFSD